MQSIQIFVKSVSNFCVGVGMRRWYGNNLISQEMDALNKILISAQYSLLVQLQQILYVCYLVL